MKRTLISLLVFYLLAGAMAGRAQEDNHSALDEEPQMPEQPVVIPDYEPDTRGGEIVIRPGRGAMYYEYRVNGQVREIKVEPEVGPPYYLVPAEGGGWIREDETSLLIPSWVIFRW